MWYALQCAGKTDEERLDMFNHPTQKMVQALEAAYWQARESGCGEAEGGCKCAGHA